MATYITYQCTVCRKTKDSEKDTLRAVPNVCSITPGCNGRLLVISEKSQYEAYNPVSKLSGDPNERLVNPKALPQSESIFLSTSGFGSLTLAVRYNSGSPENSIKLRLSQRKLNDVSYQQYVFKTTESTSVIPQSESNKDISGKFLRFNNAAILENRVSVVVNGVQKIVGTDANEISLAPNTVNFNSAIPAGSTVSVIIYSEQVTTQNDLVFERNDVLNNTGSSYGSWANIKRIDCADSIGDWYLYSCTFLSSLSYSVKIKVESVLDTSGNILKIGDELSDIRFMLATAP
jgi:hypothetical protein